MATTYHPIKSVYVKASPPHPVGTEYKISVGLEEWGEEKVLVSKIQMVFEGKVLGRKSPSYPLGTVDYKEVYANLTVLMEDLEEIDQQDKLKKLQKILL